MTEMKNTIAQAHKVIAHVQFARPQNEEHYLWCEILFRVHVQAI